MEWQRAGLLSQVEFQKAKDKILGEEPSVPRMPHMPAPPKHGIGGPDMNRGRGVQNIGLFAKWIDLEANLVGCFSPFRGTVLQK